MFIISMIWNYEDVPHFYYQRFAADRRRTIESINNKFN